MLMERTKAVWPEEGPSEALGSRWAQEETALWTSEGRRFQAGAPVAGLRLAGEEGPGGTSGDTCCWSSAALHWPSGPLRCARHPLQVCAFYLALPLDTQGPHLYANHLWGPSQQGHIENLHFLSSKLALRVCGEWTRCPTRAHKPFAGWASAGTKAGPRAGAAHGCCFSPSLGEGAGAAQLCLPGFLKRCHLTLEVRGASGPQRPSARPGRLVPRGGAGHTGTPRLGPGEASSSQRLVRAPPLLPLPPLSPEDGSTERRCRCHTRRFHSPRPPRAPATPRGHLSPFSLPRRLG